MIRVRYLQRTSDLVDRASTKIRRSSYKVLIMKSLLRFGFMFGVWGLFVFCFLGFEIYPQEIENTTWPKRYPASYGFTIMADHNGLIIVASVDSTTSTYKLGIRPGMEVLAWNAVPLKAKLESMKIDKYRKLFPLMSDQNIKLMLLTRGRAGESAEVYFMTESGNNRGVRVYAEH
jgi:hypothetical protein